MPLDGVAADAARDVCAGLRRRRVHEHFGLCARARRFFELPLSPGNTEHRSPSPGRVALANTPSGRVSLRALPRAAGAVGRQVQRPARRYEPGRPFPPRRRMPGYTPRATASRLILTDDESDLVYHIVCSRDRPDGEPRRVSSHGRVVVHHRRGAPARERNAGAPSQGVRLHERIQPRSAAARAAIDRNVIAADRRAGNDVRRDCGTSTRLSGGRLAGDPLPEES